MQVRFIALTAALVASAASFTTSVRAADRATVHQEAVTAAHTMGYGEFGPPLAQPQPVSETERMEARAARREAGSQAARFVRYGDVEVAAPAPRPVSMVSTSERRAEVRRANLAGELRNTGEVGRY